MKTSLTKGLDEQQAKEVTLTFNASAVLRERLISLLSEKSIAADKESMSKDGYDCPNWAYKQADMQGYKRALSEISSLLK